MKHRRLLANPMLSLAGCSSLEEPAPGRARDQNQFVDYPIETPIDREAGITAGPDQIWIEMPRDRRLESDILSVLKVRLGQRAPTSRSAAN